MNFWYHKKAFFLLSEKKFFFCLFLKPYLHFFSVWATDTHSFYGTPKSSCTMACADSNLMIRSLWFATTCSNMIHQSFPVQDDHCLDVFFCAWHWAVTRSAFVNDTLKCFIHTLFVNSSCILHTVPTWISMGVNLYATACYVTAVIEWCVHTSDVTAQYHPMNRTLHVSRYPPIIQCACVVSCVSSSLLILPHNFKIAFTFSFTFVFSRVDWIKC